MARDDIELWRDPATPRSCAFCRQHLGAAVPTSCRRCATAYHADCWVSNDRRCAVYGCEPAPRPVAPPREIPEVAAASRPNWAWMASMILIGIMTVGRLTTREPLPRPYRPSAFPPEALRHVTKPLELEALMEAEGPLIPAEEDDLPGFLEEAQAMESGVSSLLEIPRGRLTPELRSLLRDGVLEDLGSLRQASRLYRRCQMSSPDPETAAAVERVARMIRLKKKMLVDLSIVKAPD